MKLEEVQLHAAEAQRADHPRDAHEERDSDDDRGLSGGKASATTRSVAKKEARTALGTSAITAAHMSAYAAQTLGRGLRPRPGFARPPFTALLRAGQPLVEVRPSPGPAAAAARRTGLRCSSAAKRDRLVAPGHAPAPRRARGVSDGPHPLRRPREATRAGAPSTFWPPATTACSAPATWAGAAPGGVGRTRSPVQPGGHWLDLGCGTGEDTLWLCGRGASVFGVDASG